MIIFINGSINTGKSTIAKLLEQKLDRPALVEIDELHHFIRWVEIDNAVPINLENAVAVIRNFVKRKFNVIVPYPLSEENYRYIMDKLKDLNENIRIFTLSPKKEKAKTSTADRALSDWEKMRIDYHYKIGIAAPSFGETIDNTNQTPEETVDIIFRKLNGNF